MGVINWFLIFLYISQIRSGQDPTVDRSQRNSSYSPPRDITYCSQGTEILNPLQYGRCCPSGDVWDPDSQQCLDHASCEYCNETPFSTEWWSNENCTIEEYDETLGRNLTIQTCHPTDFFGDDRFYSFPIFII